MENYYNVLDSSIDYSKGKAILVFLCSGKLNGIEMGWIVSTH